MTNNCCDRYAPPLICNERWLRDDIDAASDTVPIAAMLTFEERIWDRICQERHRQDTQHGGGQPQNHADHRWLALTLEELGEAAQALNDLTYADGDAAHLEQEIIETAALCVAWLQNREARAHGFFPPPVG
ncbi:MAG: hypothetical protein IT340_20125 [Chloroflexi bacterium]|nr:hypothetical protein [Chloroflexota bacterium]